MGVPVRYSMLPIVSVVLSWCKRVRDHGGMYSNDQEDTAFILTLLASRCSCFNCLGIISVPTWFYREKRMPPPEAFTRRNITLYLAPRTGQNRFAKERKHLLFSSVCALAAAACDVPLPLT